MPGAADHRPGVGLQHHSQRAMNHASGLFSFMCDIYLWCLKGTQSSTSIYTGEQLSNLLTYPPLKRDLSFLIYPYLGLQSLTK